MTVTTWDKCLLFASNSKLTFKDAGGSILRRFMIWCFKNKVTNRDPAMQEQLRQELPNIIARYLDSYFTLKDEYGALDIVQHVPEQMQLWNAAAIFGGDPHSVGRFFMDTPKVVPLGDGKAAQILFVKEQGAVLKICDLVHYYKLWYAAETDCMPPGDHQCQSKVKELAVHLGIMGAEDDFPKPHFCKSCLSRHVKSCCAAYHRKNQTTKACLPGYSMQITDIEDRSDCNSDTSDM